MVRKNHPPPEYEVEYYLLDDDTVGRVKYYPEPGDYLDGEVIDESGRWTNCPAVEILMSGELISRVEALQRVRELGGVLREPY